MKKSLSQIFTFGLFILSTTHFLAQNFTWIKGSNQSGLPGAYGTMGVPSATTNPGCRHGCATWTDANGNLWLFGGEGYDQNNTYCLLNDLWRYSPVTNQWTWVRGSNGPNALSVYGTQGVAAPSNEPGAREFTMFWKDQAGNFWLFGGDGYASVNSQGLLGDLWKYDPGTNMWTWMKGFNTTANNGIYGTINVPAAGNLPGTRLYGCAWTDGSGKLYLFGGTGYDGFGGNSYLNDLWMYNIATNNWVWLGGSNVILQNGNYGTLGVASNTNIPGGRKYSSTWTDANGNFYLFGGLGLPSAVTVGYLNDLWKYNPAANTWMWVSGTNTINVNGVYGTLGVPAITNMPGSRYSNATWTDLSGNLWLFGGRGYATQFNTFLNDLWMFNPGTNRWTWMKGSTAGNANGTYGTLGSPNANNIPGGRAFNDSWRTNNGKFWLFGGEGYDATTQNVDHMNDLWTFTAPCSPDSITGTVNKVCSGGVVTLNAYNQYPSTVAWYSSPSSTNSIGGGSVFTTPTLTTNLTPTNMIFYAESNSCTVAPRTAYTIQVNPQPNIIIAASSPTVCSGQSASLVAIGAISYTWSNGSNASQIVVTPTATTNYFVFGSNQYSCSNSATTSISLVTANISASSSNSFICIGNSATLTASGANTYSWNTNSNLNSITVSPTITTTYTVSGTDANGCKGSAVISQSVNACLSINDIEKNENGIFIFPNPSNNQISIKSLNTTGNFNLIIYNIAGQKLLELNNVVPEEPIKFNLPKGIYHYSINTTDNNPLKFGKLLVAD